MHSKESHLFKIWKNFQQNAINNNTRRRQQRTSETEDEKKGKIEKDKQKDRERSPTKTSASQDEDGKVQDLAVLKQIKRAAESDEKIIIL